VDDSNKAAIRKYYRMKVYQQDVKETDTDVNDLYIEDEAFDSDEKDVYSEEMALEADSARCQNSLPPSNDSNQYIEILLDKEIRITPQEQVKNFAPCHPQKKPGAAKYSQFIVDKMRYLSKELGDEDHTASNISQATRLYERLGVSEEAFIKMLFAAKGLAREVRGIQRLNSQGGINRMPYFFKCLRTMDAASVA
jgi:hypothetical protein